MTLKDLQKKAENEVGMFLKARGWKKFHPELTWMVQGLIEEAYEAGRNKITFRCKDCNQFISTECCPHCNTINWIDNN